MKPKFIVLVDPLAPKVTIRKNGNMWFNQACNPLVNFELNHRYRFAEDEENPDVFYMVPTQDTDNTLKPVRSGKYYSIGSLALCKKLKTEMGWHYLLTKTTWEDQPIFVFTRFIDPNEPAPAEDKEPEVLDEQEQANSGLGGDKPANAIPYREEWKVVNQE